MSTSSRPLERPAAISVLALIHFVLAAFALLAVAALVLYASSEKRLPVVFALGPATVAVATLVCGFGLWTLKPWGRTLQIVLAVLALVLVPVGTLIGALVLYMMFTKPMKLLFSGRDRSTLSVDELKLMEAGSSGGMLALVVGAALVAMGGVVVLGFFAAVAFPNFLEATDRARQKATMFDMRAIAAALEAYAADHDMYPVVASVEELQSLVEPHYIERVALTDAWGHPLRIESEATSYRIASPAKDGLDDDCDDGPTSTFESDICYADGEFVQWPEGRQAH